MKFRGVKMSQESDYLQPGIHECEIFLGEEKTFMGKDKKTGNEKEYRKVGIGFRGPSGASVFADYFLNPEYLWVLEKLYRVAGIEKEDVDLPDLVGCFVKVQVKHEPYKKKDSSDGMKSVVVEVFPSDINKDYDPLQDKQDDDSEHDPF